MKLLILSDLHAEDEDFAVQPGIDFDVCVLAGDIHSPGRVVPSWVRSPARFGTRPIVWVSGNHEFYGSTLSAELEAMREQAQAHHVHLLNGDEVTIDGIRFLGTTLWTDFKLRIEDEGFGGQVRLLSDRYRSMQAAQRFVPDFAQIRIDDPVHGNDAGTRRLMPMDTVKLHRRQRAWLKEKLEEPFAGSTVVVTHHAPHRGSLAPQYADSWASGGFVSELDLQWFQIPKLWVHGHIHTSADYRVGDCRVVSNPRGYVSFSGVAENKKFNPALVVEI